MSGMPGVGRAVETSPGGIASRPSEAKAPEDTPDQGLLVVVDVKGSRSDKYLTVVRQALAVRNGRLEFVGPRKEERVETFEWTGP
jgi:hypothetical protein